MAKFYVTYGWESTRPHEFSVVEAETYLEARKHVIEVCGLMFAFLYFEKDFEGQQEDYDLTEAPLGPAEMASR